jgi:hypothetical protein
MQPSRPGTALSPRLDLAAGLTWRLIWHFQGFPCSRHAAASASLGSGETLAPHFSRALRIHRQTARNRAREQLSTEIFDRLPIGIALVDSNQQLIYTHSHFHRVAPELAAEPIQSRRWKRLLEAPGNQVEQLSLVDGRSRSLFAMPLADSGEMAVFVAAPGGFSLNVDVLLDIAHPSFASLLDWDAAPTLAQLSAPVFAINGSLINPTASERYRGEAGSPHRQSPTVVDFE